MIDLAELSKSYTSPNPSGSPSIHINAALSTFQVGWLQSEMDFVASRVVPMVPVARDSDSYWTIDLGSQIRDVAEERTVGTESVGVDYSQEPKSYYARVWSCHSDMGMRDTINADRQIRLEHTKTRTISRALLIRKEVVFADLFLKPNIWFNGTNAASPGKSVDWSNTGTDPVVDVANAKDDVAEKTGFRPNIMVVSRKRYTQLMNNEEILGRVNGGATTEVPAHLMRQAIAGLLELDALYIMDSVRNSAKSGAAKDIGYIGGMNALLAYSPMDLASEEEPTAFVNFVWTAYTGATEEGTRIRKYRNEPTDSDRIEGDMSFCMKVIAEELGYLFTA